ncbi:hypothetical protein [Brenneria corticis]|uniref:DUF3828 domain-containing protein n=1 Tax=Brenneria corticis TaxID=2173106 RepID=A0A2U1TL54_9GAMM|nr:hypothetical protein [Brenneria sp. CFCC 11842]PWC10125.1 hypothetical protein DDT56_22535 [Brenneria sp. CFCC 11842]
MFRKILSLLFFIVIAPSSFANQKINDGILQAYWLPIWNDSATVNNPVLYFRYFSLDENSRIDKIINLDVDTGKKKDNLLKEYFKDIPHNFLKYKEGHIERIGGLVVDNISVTKECDHTYHNARLITFTPGQNREFDIQKLEESAGCEAYPYVVTYSVKEGVDSLYFKETPSASAKKSAEIPVGTPLIKIKTINDKWILAAIYDAGKPDLLGNPQGYIELDKLQPLN